MAGAIQNAMRRYKILCGGRAVRAFTRRQYCALPGDCPLAHQKCTELHALVTYNAACNDKFRMSDLSHLLTAEESIITPFLENTKPRCRQAKCTTEAYAPTWV